VPLQLALHVGFLVSFCSFVAGVLDLAAKILGASTVPGWLSVAITVSFLGGMQLLILGVMGTYMGRMYEEVKLRPLYIVRQLDGIEPPAAPGARTVVVSVPSD
jgi:polyisoprenyl-phosphate glycosyltransferase